LVFPGLKFSLQTLQDEISSLKAAFIFLIVESHYHKKKEKWRHIRRVQLNIFSPVSKSTLVF